MKSNKVIEFFKKQTRKISIESILCLFIILLPLLDMMSFIFRNTYKTSLSPSTIIRPIIPIILFIIIFFKSKIKLKIIIVGAIYGIYALVHLYVFSLLKTQSSYSGLTHELQYLVNYSFGILNLFIYFYIFIIKKYENMDFNKIKKSILIAIGIYIVSIYIAIFTKTSSSTYIEGLGYKGWFGSGNSISAVLLLSMFVLLGMLKDKKIRIWVGIVIALVGVFLTSLIGTRVGLFGFIGVLILYAVVEIIISFLHKTKMNKKMLIGIGVGVTVIVITIICVGSNTLSRRKHLQSIKGELLDDSIQGVSHVSGDLLKIKQKIDTNEIQTEYMSEATQKAIVSLYDFANKYNVTNNDMRTQQLVFNFYQVLYQANPVYFLFGNGYVAQFSELILEMEIPAFLFNFGLIGFILYFMPFLAISIYACYIGIKNIKTIDSEYVMLLLGLLCSFGLAFLSGYTFFSASTALIIVVIAVMLSKKISEIKE